MRLDAQGFEILATLIEHHGAAVTDRELLMAARAAGVRDATQLWDGVAAVNLALDADGHRPGHVAHHPSAGFSLVIAPWKSLMPELPVGGLHRTAARAVSIFGRDEAIQRIEAQLKVRRFVTVAGPGGMGKTTVALAVAERLGSTFRDGICFVDLAPLTEGLLLPGAVAATLGIPFSGTLVDLAAFLRSRQMLLVLDSCEHVVEAAASFVESFLCESTQMHVLATSREPLRASGEWVYRLGPISLPVRREGLTAAQASQSPGVQLFVERVRAHDEGFALNDAMASTVVRICRQLDGIPLAIELAAPRIAQLGLQELAQQVESRLLVLEGVRRAGPRRHRTIEALLDWSYDLLSTHEQRVLKRLSVFRGSFTLTAMSHVVGDEPAATSSSAETLLDLVAKSLVTRVDQRGESQYRLLDTTRAYMAMKLAADGDGSATRERHALYVRRLLLESEKTWDEATKQEWRSIYAPWVNDVRAALDWAFSSEASDALALELTSLSLTLADQTSLMREFLQRSYRALQLVDRMPDPPPLLVLRLAALPTYLSLHRNDHGKIEGETARILGALELAEATGAAKYQAGPLTALWVNEFQLGHYARSMRWSDRMNDLARKSSDPVLAFIATRTAAQTRHFQGRHDMACRLAEQVLANSALKIPLAYFPSAIDCRVSMRIVLARSLWIQGRAQSAAEVVEECLHFAEVDTPPALCQALTLAGVPIAMWCGDWPLARQRLERLREHHEAFSFDFWRPWWKALGAVQARRSDASDPSLLPESILSAAPDMLSEHLPTLDSALLSATTLARVRENEVGWCAPEVLRVHADRIRRGGSTSSVAEAEATLEQALTLARSQGALAWELRAAMSMADLWRGQGRVRAALDVVQDVRARFVETGPNGDLTRADALLQELAG